MKLIRIDSEVWKCLQGKAVPFEDTPNAVLRQVLGIDKKESRGKSDRKSGNKRLPPGSGRTVQAKFRKPILEILKVSGEPVAVKEVMNQLEKKMKLAPVDFETVKSGQVRWRNTAQWARNELVSEGLVKKDSPRGVWQISEKGEDSLKHNGS